ncbi:GEVED domain-containing protein [Aquimarina brevivitae]|uniref:Putative secreted protein (Por secretion system target) n=1 Tax=Aquimarina brevivitae TaxID=323412 RepID=A0A4Q7PFZ1_9FLAO|nr:GEVED domain-containing protein [Aquimarina brevivitae]RZS99396.1 putative secreted protein (Por secretion system target) [Aquimarina brevivitae]
MLLRRTWIICFFISFLTVQAQQVKKQRANPTLITSASSFSKITPLANRKLIPEKERIGPINPKLKGANQIVPGKGLPKGQDPLLSKQKSNSVLRSTKFPILTFESNSSDRSPTDPTGAVGPNHYVTAKNSAFAIFDKNGNTLIPSTGLENIFPRENLGDPIVFYDSFADRFVITQFSNSPNGFLVAVSQSPDPVNDGWYTYRFETGSFPDYTKFSIWSDGYYITANKNQGQQQTSEVVYVIEREKMLLGEPNIKLLGFPLPGARINGFYSPAGFNAMGTLLPPNGDARIIYFQDDAWQGVDNDALKLWKISPNWLNPNTSTIEEAEELSVSNGTISPFDSTFDGGSFSNLPQPGTEGDDIDVLQGAVMYATNYRRFCEYNSVLLNFAVDIDDRANSDNIAAIRWYELRQSADGEPWSVYQEGTYTSPNGKSAWCGSMAMDIYGNIGMGYTTMGTTANGANQNSFAAIQYTGRLADDPLGVMTFAETTIVEGTDIQRNGAQRYGDYAQLTVDPVDDLTFWHTAEYFQNSGNNARNIVGVFKIATEKANDVGVVEVTNPSEAVFTTSETITVTVKNFGTEPQSNFAISYTVNGSPAVEEIFTGTINPGESLPFSFATTADLTQEINYEIIVETNLLSDETIANDCASIIVKNLFNNDVGVVDLLSPIANSSFTANEVIVIELFNYGGSPQTDIPVFYQINSGVIISEVFTGTLMPGSRVTYAFSQTADLSNFGTYEFVLGTTLATDEDTTNNNILRILEYRQCTPTSNCAQFGDGITFFSLSNINNTNITCGSGYEDYTNLNINLDRAVGVYNLVVRTGFAQGDAERMSVWIDFNDNTIFEDEERIISNQVLSEENTDLSFPFLVPQQANLGNHTLRIRAGDTSSNTGADLNDPCGSMQFGTTHDYTVVIGENTTPTTDLIVVYQENDQYLITMNDSNAPNNLRIYIYTITGQVIATNILIKDVNGRFVYALDMSYASTGIYFVTLGDKQKKFIVL